MTFRSGPKVATPAKDVTSYLLDPEYDIHGCEVSPSPKPFLFSADSPSTVSYNFTEFRGLVKSFASGLLKIGFKKGDRLQLFASNSIYNFVILYGTIAAGGVFSGNSSEFTVREVREQLGHFKPSIFIVGRECLQAAKEALVDKSVAVYIFDEELRQSEGTAEKHWSSLIDREGGATYQWQRLTPEECANTVAIVNYTSGTTGSPKGVEQTHRNVLLTYVALTAIREGLMRGRFRDGYWTQGSKSSDGETSKNVFLLPWHASRPFGQVQSARIKLAAVGVHEETFIIGRGYTGASELLGYASKCHATQFLAPPKVLNDIIDLGNSSPSSPPSWDLTSLQAVTSSSGPLLPRVAADAEAFFKRCGANKNLRIVSGYASTETGLVAVPDPSALSATYTTAAVGFLAPNIDLKLIDQFDPTLTISSPGTPGVIYVRGPTIAPGYYNNPTATSEVFADGWCCTGDVGYFGEDDGMLYLVDRVKDVIKAPTGMCIHPLEIETLLAKIPGVKESGIVGVRDSVTGHEVVTAFVVKNEGHGELSENYIKETVNKDLAAFKQVQTVVLLSDPLPREKLLGKLLRRELKDMARNS